MQLVLGFESAAIMLHLMTRGEASTATMHPPPPHCVLFYCESASLRASGPSGLEASWRCISPVSGALGHFRTRTTGMVSLPPRSTCLLARLMVMRSEYDRSSDFPRASLIAASEGYRRQLLPTFNMVNIFTRQEGKPTFPPRNEGSNRRERALG